MSLRLWLPLNGDLINKGLEPGIKVTNNLNLVTFVNDGKLGGQCALFDSTSKNCYLLTNYYTNFGTNNFSIAFWVKIDADNVPDNYTHIVSSKGYGASDSGVCIAYFKGSDSTNATLMFRTSGQRAGCSITNFSNKWIHFIAIRDNTVSKNVRFFVNGIVTEPDSSMTVVNTGNTAFRIGIDTDKHYFPASMLIQDVRIYDHALSDKEAKELAKGLVLHYKLDNNGYGNPNLITNEILHSSPWSDTITNYNTIYNNKNCMRLTSGGLYTYTSKNTTSIFPTITFKENTAYTLSLDWVDIRTDGKNSSMFLSFYYSDGTSSRITVPSSSTTEWTHAVLTTSAGKTVTRMGSSYGNSGNYICIANLKLEESSIETKWSPSINLLTNEIKDTSGYNHDGIIVGTLTTKPLSPKYSISTIFPTNSDYFYMPHITSTTAMTNEFTFAGWIYRNYTDATARTFYLGLCLIYLHTNFGLRILWTHASANLSYNNTNTWSSGPIILPLTWTHIAYTFLNGIVRCYINGAKYNTSDRSDTGQFICGTKGSPNASIGYSWIGGLSDLRTYATALSDEDIKELYETSVSIDNKSNIYSRQFEENDLNKISITNRGQLQMDAIEENSSTASFYKDTKDVKGLLIYEY